MAAMFLRAIIEGLTKSHVIAACILGTTSLLMGVIGLVLLLRPWVGGVPKDPLHGYGLPLVLLSFGFLTLIWAGLMTLWYGFPDKLEDSGRA